jgi:hypothetical protein
MPVLHASHGKGAPGEVADLGGIQSAPRTAARLRTPLITDTTADSGC